MRPKPGSFLMGLDQYGDTYRDLGLYPRKALMKRLGASHCAKMYATRKSNGAALHVGYVVSRRWITLYEVAPFEKEES